MDLTGRCKQAFEDWYKEKYFYGSESFWNIKPAMQWGVLVDFFEALKTPIPLDKNMMDIYYSYPGDYDKEMSRGKAIFQADKIYNTNSNTTQND